MNLFNINKEYGKLLWKQLFDEILLVLSAVGISLLLPLRHIYIPDKNIPQYVAIGSALLIIFHKSAVRLRIFRGLAKTRFNKSTVLIGFAGANLYLFFNSNFSLPYYVLLLPPMLLMGVRFFILKYQLKKASGNIASVDLENPIETPDDDEFNIAPHSEHMAGLIKSHKHKGFGILGSFGCGKSSFINLVKYYLDNEKDIVWVQIDGWGLNEGKTIIYILNKIEEELYSHSDCLSITNIPEKYQNALVKQDKTGLLTLITALLHETPSMEKTMQKLDDFIACIGKQVIVVLEDLDRNSDDKKLFKEIPGFLHQCKQCNHISFILAVSEKENTPALLRNCDFNHRFSQILPSYVSTSLSNSLSPLIGKDYIDVVGDDQEQLLAEVLGYTTPLVKTPRHLKSIAKRFKYLWKNLKGEVDFYDLFVIILLQEASPDGFRFVFENLDYLQGVFSSNKSDFYNEESEAFKKRESFISDMRIGQTGRAVDLILFLCPGLAYTKPDTDTLYEEILKTTRYYRPQRLLFTDPVNYWVRFNIGMISKGECGDQRILRTIQSCKKSHQKASEFAQEVYTSNKFAMRISHFGDYISIDILTGILSELLNILAEDKKNAAALMRHNKYSEGTSFFPLFKLVDKKKHERMQNGLTVKDWYLQEINNALHYSTLLASDLIDEARSSFREYDDPAGEDLYIQVAKIINEICETDLRAFINIFRTDLPYGLHYITVSKIQTIKIKPYDEWATLGKYLIEAMSINPNKMIPEVMSIIVKDLSNQADGRNSSVNAESNIPEENNWSLWPASVCVFFRNNFEDLFITFADNKDVDFVRDEEKNIYPILKAEAKHILEEYKIFTQKNNINISFQKWIEQHKYNDTLKKLGL